MVPWWTLIEQIEQNNVREGNFGLGLYLLTFGVILFASSCAGSSGIWTALFLTLWSSHLQTRTIGPRCNSDSFDLFQHCYSPSRTVSASFHLQSLAAETSFHHLSAGTLISNRDLVLQQSLDLIVYPDIVREAGGAGRGVQELTPNFIPSCYARREWTPKQTCGQARVSPRCR